MSSMAGAVRLSNDRGGITVAWRLAAAMGVTGLLLFVGLAGWLFIRRLSGALTLPLNGTGFVMSALAIELATLGVRRAMGCAKYTIPSTQYSVRSTQSMLTTQYGNSPAVTVAAVVALISLSSSATPIWSLLIAWIVVLGGEMWPWLPQLRPYLNRIFGPQHSAAVAAEREFSVDEAEVPAGLVQQLTRVRELNEESIHVLASAEIAAGDRIGVVHISFCPPLASRPELTAHAMEADDVEVRLTLAETFGARVEVRARQNDPAPRHMLIEVMGTVRDQKSA